MSRKPKPLDIQPRKKRNTRHSFPRNPDDYPCPVCGGNQFEWGVLKGSVAYSPKETMMPGGEPLRARVCQTCGNVLTFLEG